MAVVWPRLLHMWIIMHSLLTPEVLWCRNHNLKVSRYILCLPYLLGTYFRQHWRTKSLLWFAWTSRSRSTMALFHFSIRAFILSTWSMWRLASAAKRERITVTAAAKKRLINSNYWYHSSHSTTNCLKKQQRNHNTSEKGKIPNRYHFFL